MMNAIKLATTDKVIYWYAVAALALPNVALCFTEGMPLVACLTNVLLPLGVYMALMTLTAKVGKMVWWAFVLIFFAAFQMVLLYLFGQGVIAVDMFLNLVTTNPGEAMELLDNLVPAVLGVVVVYVPLLVLGVVSIRRVHGALALALRRAYRRYALMVTTGGLACLALAYATVGGYRLRDSLYPVNVVYNLILAIQRNNASANYHKASADFRFNARATHTADSTEVYVMVIGETARACNFGLYGYQRNTTPLLEHTPGVVAFTHAYTQSNTTHKSVPMLLSAVSAVDFEQLFHEKGILAAFREAGFHTVFLSNQLPNHSFIDFLGQQADEWQFVKERAGRGANCYDGDLLPLLDQVLSKGRKREFIVLHTYGSHFNYRERYPRQMAYYKPDDRSEAEATNRRDLVNAYDNTIRYTDWLLASVARRLERHAGRNAMLYTSDHGENIFDDSRELFLHASPKASQYELHVPFIVWTSSSYRQAYPSTVQALAANRKRQLQSSLSVFHTMLDVAGVETPLRQLRYSVASSAYTPMRRLYLNDHDEAVAY